MFKSIIISRAKTVLFGVLLTFIILEILSRTILPKTQRVIIENLQQDSLNVKDIKGVNLEFQKEHRGGLYYVTKSGMRVLPNSKTVVKNHYMNGQDITIITNSLGYRYSEIGEKKQDEYRILVLGDSITFGDYLNVENTYPYYLERFLHEKLAKKNNKLDVKVINAGVGAIGIENELAILSETGLSIKPDLILLQLYLNDANESLSLKVERPPKFSEDSYFINYLYDFINKQRLKKLYYHFHNPEFSREADIFTVKNPVADEKWEESVKGFNNQIYNNFQDWGYAWSDKSTEKIKQALIMIQDLAEYNNIKLVVGIFPVRYQVHANILRNEPQIQYTSILDRQRIASIDLLPILREKYAQDKVNIYYDICHYKPEGNEFIASKLSDFLEKQM
ncbi:hypothetical protein A3D03_00085 [Candidatus Gottesmanbacteria bacterium RIFCSPHIGHO2_02_FULL_40_13]|uniref:SGNH hydrolase-type esterase domain-containing protein n=1 Tax=Candidatus Gottesmanbacteria bacterium RIFCSPHIGHO2_02_FULL_40_13 TaxID=1798384 RepID=A0A1F6A836_9BACT|nr:MAG: hypothetical protein A3D03_00085 [Candidatus Gottesmanbacteria bacterium RIFCSPHIGHO2_02_FULL_40_13]